MKTSPRQREQSRLYTLHYEYCRGLGYDATQAAMHALGMLCLKPAAKPAVLRYSVKALRDAGLECRWTRNGKGAPIIIARWPEAKTEHQRGVWWYVSRQMWESMQSVGIIEGFDRATLLGDVFSV